MSTSASSSNPVAPLTSKKTGLVLLGVVALCIALIGLASYVKYELDRAGSALASPELMMSPEQQAVDKIRRDLGYGGFLGLAQNLVNSHDAVVLPDMKAALRLVHDSFEHMPENTPAETSRALQAIIANFDAAMQKAEKATADFSMQDLAPLYASLPILDTRIGGPLSADRKTEQEKVQLWATLLTVISWGSLIIASALAAGIYLVLRDRNSAPMRALAQSVKNMARGDMRTSIWGMERQDAIGELARSVDMARFHFSQLPDMSLLSEQGPVRIRFEGNTRSLFEAMMRVISRDSESVHEQASLLTENVTKHQESLADVINRVDAVLQSVESRANAGDQQVQQVINAVLSSAESLKNAQEHASDQLNRIIPFLQERTQGISEITQIAGKQVSQALQSLSSSERGLRASAEHSEAAIQKFSTAADTLGERMFGAVNLLQASGKILSETAETMQSRLDQTLSHLSSATALAQTSAASPAFDPVVAERFGSVVEALESSQSQLQQILTEQAESAKAHINLLITQSSSLLTQTSTSSQTLSSASDRLREEQTRLSELLNKMAEFAERPAAPPSIEIAQTLVSPLLVDIREGFATIEQRFAELHDHAATSSESLTAVTDHLRQEHERMGNLLNQMHELVQQPAAPALPSAETAEVLAAPVLANIKTGFTSLEQRFVELHKQALNNNNILSSVSSNLIEKQSHIGDVLNKVTNLIENPVVPPPPSAETAQAFAAPFVANIKEGFTAIEQRVAELNQQTATNTQALYSVSSNLIEKQAQVGEVLNKVTHLIENPVAPPPPSAETAQALTAPVVANVREGFANIEQRFTALHEQASSTSNTLSLVSNNLLEKQMQIGEVLNRVTHLIENPTTPPPPSTETAQALAAPLLATIKEDYVSIDQRVATLNEQVSKLVGIITEPQPLPREMSEQMRDQWYQMASQIEASRSNLAQIILQQSDKVEAQLEGITKHTPASPAGSLAKETQIQLEQQTHILSELVNALSLLDAHMQDIRGQISASRRAG